MPMKRLRTPEISSALLPEVRPFVSGVVPELNKTPLPAFPPWFGPSSYIGLSLSDGLLHVQLVKLLYINQLDLFNINLICYTRISGYYLYLELIAIHLGITIVLFKILIQL